MSTKKNIEFHSGETWQINFSAHNADGSSIALDGTVTVRFRINAGPTVLLTKSIGSGIVVISDPGGLALITVTPADQISAGIAKNKTYAYEVQLTTTQFVSVQAEGQLKVLPSLFGP